MKKLFWIFLLIFLNTFSQESFKKTVYDLEADSLLSLSYRFQFREEQQEKLNLVVTAIEKKLKNNNFKNAREEELYRALYLKAYYDGNFKEAISYADFSKKAAVLNKNNHFVCLAHIIKAQSYFELGKYEESLQQHLKSLEVATKNDILNLKIACVGNLGNFKLLCGDSEGAIEILENTVKEIEANQTNQKYWLKGFYPEMYSDLTLAYLNSNQLQKAKDANSIAISSSKKHKYYLSANLLNKALIETATNDYDSALQTIEKADAVVGRNHHKFKYDALKHLAKGKIYFLKGDYKIALSQFLQLEKLQEKNKISHLSFQEGLSYIAKIYSKLGENSLALEYYNKALATFTESEQQKVKLISEITKSYNKNEIDKILKDKNLTNAAFVHEKYASIEKQIQKLQSESHKKNTYMLWIVIGSLVLIITIIVIFLENKKRNKQKLNLLLAKIAEKEKTVQLDKKERSLQLKDAEIERIIKGLHHLQQQEFFLKIDCTAINVAKKLETNTTYLSKIINSYYQKSFSNYINDLRVNYVLNRLKNDKLFRRYSIQSIANEIGFKSRESFNNVFKKETGILPSYFIKQLDN